MPSLTRGDAPPSLDSGVAPMKRSVGFVMLLALAAVFASFGEGRTEEKEKPKAKVYKTPQDVFDAFDEADRRNDHKTVAACLAPQAQKEPASMMVITFATLRSDAKNAKDEKTQEL